MTYIDDNLHRLGDRELDALIRQFPPQRCDALLRYRNEAARRQGALAYLLLCRALHEEYGITAQPTFSYGEHGKPSLAEHPRIHFNLSHCRTAVACAVSLRPVGIDIESIRQAKPALVRHTMSESEAARLLASARPDVEFTILWTRKEALLKLTGRGIVSDMRNVLTDCVASIETTVRPLYIYSVASTHDTRPHETERQAE